MLVTTPKTNLDGPGGAWGRAASRGSKGPQQHGHDHIGRDSQGEKGNESPAGGGVVGGLRPGHALDGPLPEPLGGLG